jgi:protein-L-isoaspartate(D-aspartate) O-methyltransferase
MMKQINGTRLIKAQNVFQSHNACLMVIWCCTLGSIPVYAADPLQVRRDEMVAEYITKEGVTNERVLAAMRKVPRHLFCIPVERSKAYLDQALALGFQQTISPPFIVAYMTECIDPQPDDKVLEIGTGSGYQAAVLGEIVKEVYSIEIVEPLGKRAAQTLKSLKYDNVHTLIGDGYKGWPEHAPYDKIIVTCSPESIPQPLVEQLKEGGKIIVPMGERYSQAFYLLEKKDGKMVESKLIPTLFVPMTGTSETNRRVQPDPIHPRIFNGGFEVDSNNDGLVDSWHYQRRTLILSDDPPEGKHYLSFQNDVPGRMCHILQGSSIDGSRIGSVRISMMYRTTEGVQAGPHPTEVPCLYLHLYNGKRQELKCIPTHIFQTTPQWTDLDYNFEIPPDARELIIQIGLNGGTGRLDLDRMTMSSQPR